MSSGSENYSPSLEKKALLAEANDNWRKKKNSGIATLLLAEPIDWIDSKTFGKYQ